MGLVGFRNLVAQNQNALEVGIPPLRGPEGWRSVAIQDSNEALVELGKGAWRAIRCDPRYWAARIPNALAGCFCRLGVARRLAHAAKLLETSGRILLVWDAWRPYDVQRAIYESYFVRVKISHPEVPEEELHRLTQVFVSYPSIDSAHPSPHLTGGAIDLTLADSGGRLLDMGTDFDDFSPAAKTRHYEELIESEPLAPAQTTALRNRRLLFNAMSQAGFTNYFEEWWHYDLGNQFWGRIRRKPAMYGGVESGVR